MSEKIKTYLKLSLFIIFFFIISSLITGVFFFSITYKLYEFKLLSFVHCLILGGSLALLVSVLIVIYTIADARSNRTNKLILFIKNNFAKLLLGYVLISITIASIRDTALWSIEEIEQVLSVEWMIFGLSITIFLVWDVLIVKYLKGKQSNKQENESFKDHYATLLNKQLIYNETQSTFNVVIVLTINLFILIIATLSVYVVKKPESLFTQNMTIGAFYFSTNSLIGLFLDILKPLREEKRKILEENKVSATDVNVAHFLANVQTIIETYSALINSNPSLSDQEKADMIRDFNSKFIDGIIAQLQNNAEQDTPSTEERKDTIDDPQG